MVFLQQARERTFDFATKKAKRKSRKVSAVLAKVPLSEKSTPEPDRSFRFGLPLDERSNSGSDAEAAASPQVCSIRSPLPAHINVS